MEQAIAKRGWRQATSPADADVLAVCGTPGPALAQNVEKVWDQLPGPRVRVAAVTVDDVTEELLLAAQQLLSTDRHRLDARQRAQRPARTQTTSTDAMDQGTSGVDKADHGAMDHDSMNHASMDHGPMDMGVMDHGTMDMAPEGIPLAAGAEDRDGLEMDELNIRLGPVLPHWPAGLVLRCALHGDVVVRATAEVLDGEYLPPSTFQPPALVAARQCNAVADLLALAGWQDASSHGQRIRNSLLVEHDVEAVIAEMERLQRRLKRSWLLRWSLRNIAPFDKEQLHRQGLPERLAGDTYDRLLRMADRPLRTLMGDQETLTPQDNVLAALPEAVNGLDLATVRLAVASLDLDTSTPGGHA